MTTDEVLHELDRQHVPYDVVAHRRTETARQEASAVGVPAHEVAKTIILATDDGFVRAVVPASKRLDVKKARRAVGEHGVRLATEAELGAAYPAFELGAVPPFAGPAGDRVIMDRQLAEQQEVVLEAGTHNHSVKLRAQDLVKLSAAEVADISAD